MLPTTALHRPDVVNLCFHGIGRPRRDLEPGEERYWIPVDTYHRILDAVAGDPRVRLSFDDGNASDVEVGLPALLERGLTACFFALAGRLGRPGSLSDADLRGLAEAGMDIGSHGMDHVPWRGLDRARRHRELSEARRCLESVSGATVDRAALPLGRYDRRVLAALRTEGYRTVFTSDRRWARSGSWLQPRFSVQRDDTPDTIRAQALAPTPLVRRARNVAVGAIKRYR